MPAPGAKCQACLLRDRRGGLADGDAPKFTAPASEAVVKARDEAIVRRLWIGPATEAQLLTVLPLEDGHTAADRERALKSALIRLRVKRQITNVEGGWAAA